VKVTVLQNVRSKYACRNCDPYRDQYACCHAPMPKQPLPGSIATASTLAVALVHKYVDGTPLYRLSQALDVQASLSAVLLSATGCTSEKHLSRIYDTLKLRLRAQTVIQVLKEPGKEAISTSYMWAFRCGEDSKQSIVLFDYRPGRRQEHPQAFGDYRGILMIDGYQAWRTLKVQRISGAWRMPGGSLSMLPKRARNPVGRRRRPSSSSTSSTD